MDLQTLQSILGNLQLNQQSYPEEMQPTGYQSKSYAQDPMYAPQEYLGINPSDLSFTMQNYQGAPENYVPKDFSASEWQKLPLMLSGGGNTMNMTNTKGIGMAGRLGGELPLNENLALALGLSGRSSDVTYGMGQDWQGRSARGDISGIDATLRDLANNREFGAKLEKDVLNNPFASVFYKQRF